MPVQPSPASRPSPGDAPQIDAVAQARLAKVAGTTPKAPTVNNGDARLQLALAREQQKAEAARIRANATKYRARKLAESSTASASQRAAAQVAHDRARRLEQAAKKRLELLKAQQRASLQGERFAAQQQAQVARQVQQGRMAASDKGALPDYIRANGRMSVARRTAVVEPALERLGYPPEQARDIALDAPLDSSMTDQDALLAALRYARTLAQPNALSAALMGPQPQRPGQSLQGQQGAVLMPDAAKAALARAEEENAPAVKQFGRRSGASRAYLGLSRLANALRGRADTMANIPTPGGLGGLFLANLLLLFFAVPANSQGYTRAALLWLTLLNRTTLPEAIPQESIPASPLVAAAMGLATNVGVAAQAIGSLGQQAQSVVGAIVNPGQALEQGLTNAATSAATSSNPAGPAVINALGGVLVAAGFGGGPTPAPTAIAQNGGGPPPPPMPPGGFPGNGGV